MMDDAVRDYLDELESELQRHRADPALVQDVRFDAAEFFESAIEAGSDAGDAAAAYGTPAEVVAAYLDREEREPPEALTSPRVIRDRERRRLFAAPAPATWANIAYLLLSLGTGIAYFTVALVGVSLSLTLAVFIIGVPVFLAFVGVVRTIGLVEGRIIETLLGTRMPRKPVLGPGGTWLVRFKHWVTDRRTWTSVVYLFLQLPLGIAYFVGTVASFAISGWLIVGPWLQAFAGVPFIGEGPQADFFLDPWAIPFASATGVLLLFVLLRLAPLVTAIHARYAKWMLVGSLGRPVQDR